MSVVQNRLLENRERLGDKLPLATPYVLVVDPSSLCNLRCRFCPSGHEDMIAETGRSQQVMDFALYQKMIDGLVEFDQKIRVLRLYKEGEPLVNPRFADMVRYGKDSGFIGRIDTTTNGVLFSPELNRKIIDAGIDQINISVNGINAEMMKQYTQRNIDFKLYVNNIKDLYQHKQNCLIYIKAIQDNLTDKEKQLFLNIFGEFADRIFLERLAPAWPDFVCDMIPEKFETGHYGQKIENRKVCPYIFYTIVVNADGSVSSCVGDWRHKQILGYIEKNSLHTIWDGNDMQQMQVMHLRGEMDKFPMCKMCKVITHGSLDNIDADAEAILERMKRC